MTTTVAWVIGARGLLGTAVTAEIASRAHWQLLPADPLPWSEPELLDGAAADTMTRLLDEVDALAAVDAAAASWAIVWVGGAAVTSTTERLLDEEFAQLESVLAAVESRLSRSTTRGAVFYASSAGGVYGGSANPPFTESTEPSPISPYGHFKLRAEAAIERFGERTGVPTLAGRIANLYGPGQKLEKMQGLISQLARAQYSPAPASIFVSLDTTRDYLYVTDAAALVCDALDELRRTADAAGVGAHVTKILASGSAATIGELLGHFHALVKGHPHIMLGQSSAAALQAIDLRLRSTVWPHLDRRDLTPLPVGIHATMRSVLAELTAATAS
jgi:UDP-glucose 4-epimerase